VHNASIFRVCILASALGFSAVSMTAQSSDESGATPHIFPAHDMWTMGSTMPTPRSGAATCAIATTARGGKIYVVGGVTAPYGAILDVNEIYDTATDTWTTGAPLPMPTCYTVGAVVNGILYVIGGSNGIAGTTNAVWAYNPITDAWSSVAPMPTARSSLSAVVDNGVIYVIGGYAGGRIATVESYSPQTDTWTEEAPLLVGKSNPNVGHRLKAPYSADFQSYNYDVVKQVRRGAYYVEPSADAVNTFGAKLRTKFGCAVGCTSSDDCAAVEVQEFDR
jgi:hypothetical protein